MITPFARRSFFRTAFYLALATLPALAARPGAALAQGAGCTAGTLCFDVSARNFKPMPIAIVEFTGEPGQAREVAQVLSNNLKRSGVFEPLDPTRHPERNLAFDATPNFGTWSAAGAQALINGRIVRDGTRLAIEYRLWDISGAKQVIGQRHAVDAAAWRRLAHLSADAVYEKLTGESGFFDTRIVFVDETGPKDRRKKRLAIIDSDGANFRTLSSGDELLVTPRFSPRGNQVAFMAFGNGKPQVQVLDLASGRRQSVGDANQMSFAPRFAPDGTSLVMSVETSGNANLVTVGIGGGSTRPLTSGSAIDTSPSYSPDGSQIVFESDRGGGQQIYVMGADGGGAKRISFGDGRYSTPVWSPKGDYIAFTKQKSGSFAIGIMKPDGSGERILTEGFHNEGPSWAPNGRYITFFRDAGAGPKLFMVDVTGRVDVAIPTPNFSSDPAWSPLLGAR